VVVGADFFATGFDPLPPLHAATTISPTAHAATKRHRITTNPSRSPPENGSRP